MREKVPAYLICKTRLTEKVTLGVLEFPPVWEKSGGLVKTQAAGPHLQSSCSGTMLCILDKSPGDTEALLGEAHFGNPWFNHKGVFLLSYLLNPCVSGSSDHKNHLVTWSSAQISSPHLELSDLELPGEHPRRFWCSEEFGKLH